MDTAKIALLGATSKTGIELIKLASTLPALEIFAFVRNAEKLKKSLKNIPKNLQIIHFDVRGKQNWVEPLSKCDVWISIIGIAGLFQARNPNQLYEKTAYLLTEWAEKLSPKKVLVVTSGGVIESETEPWILKKVLKPYFLNPMYEDMRKMEEIIKRSTMNYTVVRPPYLTNGNMKAKYRIIINDWFKDDDVLSRKDLAHFLMEQSFNFDETFNRKFVGISY